MTCPVCGQDDQHFLRCQYPGCPDGRHAPKYRKSPWGDPPARVPSEENLPINAEGPALDAGSELFKELSTVRDIYPPEALKPGEDIPVRLIAGVTGAVIIVWGFAIYGAYKLLGNVIFGW